MRTFFAALAVALVLFAGTREEPPAPPVVEYTMAPCDAPC